MINYDDDAYARLKKTRDDALKKSNNARQKVNGMLDPHECKYKVDGRDTRSLRRDIVAQKAVNLELVTSLEFEAWRLRTGGYKVYEIAEQLQATTSQVTVWLQDALAQVRSGTKDLIDLDRELELSRTEELLKHYMPLAVFDSVTFERMQRGEPISVEDFEAPQKAAWIVIELIKLRCKVLGITISEQERGMMPAVEVIGWLRTQHEFIKNAAQDAPRDVLSLETDQPIDHEQQQQKNQTNTNLSDSEDFQDAL